MEFSNRLRAVLESPCNEDYDVPGPILGCTSMESPL